MLSTVAGLYRVPDRALRHDHRVHEQPVLGLDARLRQPRVDVRRRERRWTTWPSGSASTGSRSAAATSTQPGDANPQGFVDHLVRDARVPRRAGRGRRRAACRRRAAGLAARRRLRGACSTSAGGARIYRSDGCGAIVKLDDFGKVSLITGATEIGQGSETVLAMIVAETLGVPLERVDVVNSDTAVKPWDVGAHASRTTFIAGNAARLAAEKLRAQLLAHGGRAAGRRRRSGCASRDGFVFVARRAAAPAALRARRRGPGTTATAGRRWWPRRSTIRRRRCSTRTCAATSRPPTASPRRRSLLDVEEATGRIEVRQRRLRPRRRAARSTRSPPRGRSTAASTWGSATR